MKFWVWLFGKKEVEEPKPIVLNAPSPIVKSVQYHLGMSAPNSKYPFGPKVTNDNIDKLIRYVIDNTSRWNSQGIIAFKYDDLEYKLNTYTLEHRDNRHKGITYVSSSEMTFHPRNTGFWLKLESGAQYSSDRDRQPFRCEKIVSTTSRYDTKERMHEYSNKFRTDQEVYTFFYRLFTEGEEVVDKAMRFDYYKRKSGIEALLTSEYEFMEINGGTHYAIRDYSGYSYLEDASIYRFEDWKLISKSYDNLYAEFGDEKITFKKCENPEKEHWQHFVRLKQKAVLKRDQEIHEYVDDILSKAEEYAEIISNEYHPASLNSIISNYDDFYEFCDTIKQDHKYNRETLESIIVKRLDEKLRESYQKELDDEMTLVYNKAIGIDTTIQTEVDSDEEDFATERKNLG